MQNFRSRCVLAAAMCTVFVACGSRVKGIYTGDGFFDRLNFKSGGKVEITFMTMTKEGTFAVEGNKVKLTAGGDTQVLAIDDKGCLDGGRLLGKYCKGEASGASGSSRALSGAYKAGDSTGGITLNFLQGRQVHLTMVERGARPETANGTYQMDGDKVTISVRGGLPMVLRRRGNALEGAFGGRGFTFEKQ